LFNIGVLGIDEGNNIYPEDLKLFQNYPNPFNPSTKIKFSVPTIASDFSSKTTLKVYDILGEEVATLVNEQILTGNYEVRFDATNLSSGIYLYKIQAGDYTDVKKMILMK
jgi:hypothetical protein